MGDSNRNKTDVGGRDNSVNPSTGKRTSSTRAYNNNDTDNSSKNGRFQRPNVELARRGKSYDNRASSYCFYRC